MEHTGDQELKVAKTENTAGFTALLCQSGRMPSAENYDAWIAVGGARARGDAGKELENIPERLERAFDAVADDWLEVARLVGEEPSSELSHMPTCATNVSDFGEMLAWTRIVEDLAAETNRRILVICDDPWLFRHLATRSNVSSGIAPVLTRRRVALFVRGYLARLAYGARAALDVILLRNHRIGLKSGGAWLQVYGHPKSTASGMDGYFGDLPQKIPTIRRLLHVDCPRDRATELSATGNVFSLRAWGSVFAAAALPFARWRPARKNFVGPYGWLFRRAAALEGGTAQPAAIRWQITCQNAWLAHASPDVVAWPWESHSWERRFTETARDRGTRTLGYQHSVIGRHMLNYSPRSCPKGPTAVPDQIFCTGKSTLNQLADWGVPADRLEIGGALRFSAPATVRYDPAAPVFVALPFDHLIAAEMLSAVKACARTGQIFVVRDHPMTPFEFGSDRSVRRADGPLTTQEAASVVLYAATTVGLEALIAGLPTLRFRSSSSLSIDILPNGVAAPTTDSHSLKEALSGAVCPEPVDRASIFAEADLNIWQSYLQAA